MENHIQNLKIRRPFDLHLHVRDGDFLAATIADSAARFAGAIIMPNLRPPVTNVAMANDYLQRIKAVSPASGFLPMMTLYLTDKTTIKDVEEVSASNEVFAFKLYPAGATTNSDFGVTNLDKCDDVFEAMTKHAVPLLIHGEVTDPSVDIFDRERVFIEVVLLKLRKKHPELKICFEHITTKDAVDYVVKTKTPTFATITAHHLLENRNSIFKGGIRPHYFCLPVLKREEHRQALVRAAISNSGKFFLGTDSAPHTQSAKENACGCAGIYTSHAGIELYAEVFDKANALDKLENFASVFGPKFYNITPSDRYINLIREDWVVPEVFAYGEETLVPFRSGEKIAWKI